MPGPVPPIPRCGDRRSPEHHRRSLPCDEPWVTRSDGTYRAYPASPGRVRVLVHHPQYIDAVSDTVSLAPGGTVKLDVVMRAGGTLEGRVLDAGGKPVEGSRVVLAAARGGLERVARTASDGTFGFAAVPCRRSPPGLARRRRVPVEMRAQVSVPEGGKRSVTLQLPVARDPLPVLVRDDRGYPVATAQVTVMSLDPTSALRETVFTDAQRGSQAPASEGARAPRGGERAWSRPGHGARGPDRRDVERRARAGRERVGARALDARAIRSPTRRSSSTPSSARDALVRRPNGAFTICDLAPGSARLAVRATGFARVTRDVSIDPNGGQARDDASTGSELARGGRSRGSSSTRGEIRSRAHGSPRASSPPTSRSARAPRGSR